MRTSSGITLSVVPAVMVVTESTMGSKASILRVTKLCSACTISHATGTGSRVNCGIEAWPPRPAMWIITRSAAAIIGPGRAAITPLGILGEM